MESIVQNALKEHQKDQENLKDSLQRLLSRRESITVERRTAIKKLKFTKSQLEQVNHEIRETEKKIDDYNAKGDST